MTACYRREVIEPYLLQPAINSREGVAGIMVCYTPEKLVNFVVSFAHMPVDISATSKSLLVDF